MEKRLLRDTNNRLLGGVSSGLANYLGLDANLIRLAWVLLLLIGWGFTPMLYAIMWIIIPKAESSINQEEPENYPQAAKSSGCLVTFLKIVFAIFALLALFVVFAIIICFCFLAFVFISGIISGELTLQTVQTMF